MPDGTSRNVLAHLNTGPRGYRGSQARFLTPDLDLKTIVVKQYGNKSLIDE